MRWLWLALVAAFAIDRPVARWIAPWEPSPIWDRGVELAEWMIGLPLWRFGATAVVIGGMVAAVLVPRWRGAAHTWMLIAGTHVFARFAMITLKDATGRLRPSEWDGGATFGRDGLSFPSGHVVLFASLIVPIVMRWPRARGLLAIVAFVMAARVAVGAHFVSDVVAGLLLVVLIAAALQALLTRTAARAPTPRS